jgi:prefoldin subunit 5
MKNKIKILHKQLDAVQSQIKALTRDENFIMKQISALQRNCQHLKYVELGREVDSQKHLYQCQDCLFVGYFTDFK